MPNLMDAFYDTLTVPEVPAPTPTKIRYSVRHNGYNARRYSRPWIGVITAWPVGGRPEITWGSYNGDDSGGETEIMAYPGSILRSGQKDNRGNNTDNEWLEAMPDGSVRDIDQVEARKLYTTRGGK